MNPSSSSTPEEKLSRIRRAPHDIESMIELAAILREPGGCDWDRKQDLSSMQPHLLEEAHELIHAVATLDIENFKEELGDLLFLVVFFARLAEEKGWFNLYQAAQHSVEKLIFRHPHVFGDLEVSGSGEILKNWEKLKEKEKGKQSGKEMASGGPNTSDSQSTENASLPSNFGANTAYLPALHRAEKLQKKAALKGFDWDNIEDVRAKLDEELAELDELIHRLKPSHGSAVNRNTYSGKNAKEANGEALQQTAPARGTTPAEADRGSEEEPSREADRSEKERGTIEDRAIVEKPQSQDVRSIQDIRKEISGELGDVLFCVVNLARHLQVPAELSLHESCEKFILRFRAMEDISEVDLEGLSLDELEALYQKARVELKGRE